MDRAIGQTKSVVNSRKSTAVAVRNVSSSRNRRTHLTLSMLLIQRYLQCAAVILKRHKNLLQRAKTLDMVCIVIH